MVCYLLPCQYQALYPLLSQVHSEAPDAMEKVDAEMLRESLQQVREAVSLVTRLCC